jgi:hypothetical protein
VVRTEVKVDPSVLARYVGTYQVAPDFSVTFTLEGNQLMTQATDQPKFPVYPENDIEARKDVLVYTIPSLPIMAPPAVGTGCNGSYVRIKPLRRAVLPV